MSKLHWRRVPQALAAMVLIVLSIAAQAARPDAAIAVGGTLPKGRVAASIKAYNGWLDQVMARNDAAGIATAVIVDDKVRWQRTLGYADAATGAKVTPYTVFRIASLSKAFASALTGLLVQDGTFGWNTRIEQALPFFMLKNAEYARQATIADILSQRLGLPHNAYDNIMENNGRYPELVRKLDEVEPICPPGDCYSYQNVAFSLIGDVVYAETGDFYYPPGREAPVPAAGHAHRDLWPRCAGGEQELGAAALAGSRALDTVPAARGLLPPGTRRGRQCQSR